MKVFLIIATLFTVYHGINCIVCTPDFCAKITCPSEVVCKEETEVFVEKGGTCKCCDVCYKKLYEGHKCVPRYHGGGAFLAKCVDNLVCGPEGECIKSN